MRLIDADKLAARLNDLYKWCRDERRSGIEQAMCMVHEELTVDTELVRQGEWLVSAGGKVCTCPVCGDEFDNTCNYDIRKDWKRCPVCETKMG
jgi:hypothetical protein